MTGIRHEINFLGRFPSDHHFLRASDEIRNGNIGTATCRLKTRQRTWIPLRRQLPQIGRRMPVKYAGSGRSNAIRLSLHALFVQRRPDTYPDVSLPNSICVQEKDEVRICAV